MRLARAPVLVALLLAAAPAAATDYAWNNASGGDWATAANWSPTGIPGAADNAAVALGGTYTATVTDTRAVRDLTIDAAGATVNQTAGTLTVGGALAVRSGALTLAGGTLKLDTGSSGLTVATGAALTLSGGTLDGPAQPATATVNGAFTWSAGAIGATGAVALTVNGAANLDRATNIARGMGVGSSLTLAGTATLNNTQSVTDEINLDGLLRVAAGATVVNDNVASGGLLVGTAAGTGRVEVAGTYRKQGAGVTTYQGLAAVDVTGLMDVQAGVLRIESPGTHTGEFRVAAGARLELARTHTLTGAVKFTGGGDFSLSDGTLQVNTDEVLMPRLALVSVRVAGTGSLRVAGPLRLWNAQLEGGGSVFADGPLAIDGATLDLRGTRELRITGDATWTTQAVRLADTATLRILHPGVLTSNPGAGTVFLTAPQTGTDSQLELFGTFVKEGTGTTILSARLAPLGVIDVRAGRLEVTDLRVVSGEIHVAAGATFAQTPGFGFGAVVTWPGLLRGSGTVLMPVQIQPDGQIKGGTTTGALTVGGGHSVTLAAGSIPSRVLVGVARTGPGAATAGRIAVTGTGAFEVTGLGSDRRFQLHIEGEGLRVGETYEVIVATAGGGIRRNGVAVGANYTFAPEDYYVTTGEFGTLIPGAAVFTTDTNTLVLRFTPVPEPGMVLAASAAGLLAVARLRRRRYPAVTRTC